MTKFLIIMLLSSSLCSCDKTLAFAGGVAVGVIAANKLSR
jgi:hypothetical protein